MPNTTTYKQALRLFDDPAEYPIFPFYTANQADKAAAAAAGNPGSNNFSTINSTVQFRLLLLGAAQLPQPVDHRGRLQEAAVLERLGAVRRRQHPVARRQRVLGRLERLLDHLPLLDPPQHPGQQQLDRHRGRGRAAAAQRRQGRALADQHRLDPLRGQQPALPQRRPDHRLGRPGRRVVRYPGVPEGYSIYINGTRAATVNQLVPFTWDPATGAVTTGGTVTFNTAVSGLQAPNQVAQTSARMVDMLAKAGVDLTANLTNLAAGATVTPPPPPPAATSRGAIDGFPTNEPFWGAGGSANGQDWYEVNFGTARTLNEVRLYFKDSRPANATYRAPSAVPRSSTSTAAPGRTCPARPRPRPRRGRTTTWCSSPPSRPADTGADHQRLRRQDRPHRGQGLQPGRHPAAAHRLRQPGPVGDPVASFTSAWESVAAINDGIEPPSSNDTANPRWGTWPNTGQQWAELTWSSAQTLNQGRGVLLRRRRGHRHAGLVEAAVLERHRLRRRAGRERLSGWRRTSTTTSPSPRSAPPDCGCCSPATAPLPSACWRSRPTGPDPDPTRGGAPAWRAPRSAPAWSRRGGRRGRVAPRGGVLPADLAKRLLFSASAEISPGLPHRRRGGRQGLVPLLRRRSRSTPSPPAPRPTTCPATTGPNTVNVTNDQAYNGMYVFFRGIQSPYSTGYPAAQRQVQHQERPAAPRPLHRSTAMIFEYDEAGHQLFTSLADEDWYRTEIQGSVLDVLRPGHARVRPRRRLPQRLGRHALTTSAPRVRTTRRSSSIRAATVPLDTSYHPRHPARRRGAGA